MKKDRKKRMFLIDGSALLYRSFFAFISNPLINSKGENTSAIFGFTKTLLKILKEEKPDYIAVVFDSPEPTFRHKTYPLYKATREKMPDELSEQLPIVEEIIKAFNIEIIKIPGVEADDIIASIAVKSVNSGNDVFIVTADKDFFQFVSDNIFIYNLRAKNNESKYIGKEEVYKKFGVYPDLMLDYLSIIGDSSDNIPGIKGIGPKTALKLLKEYGTAENIFENLDKVKPSLREKLLNGKEDYLLSKKLILIKTDIEIEKSLDDLTAKKWNRENLIRLFYDLEFASLLKEIAHTSDEEDIDYVIVDENNVKNIVKSLNISDILSFDMMFFSNEGKTEIVCVSFSNKEKQSFCFPNSENGQIFAYAIDILKNEKIKKVCHNAKELIRCARENGFFIGNIFFDTMIASFLIDPLLKEISLAQASIHYLGLHKKSLEEITGKTLKKIKRSDIQDDVLFSLSMENSDYIWRVYSFLSERIKKEKLSKLFQKIEMPLIEILYEMEKNGILLDIDYLNELSLILNNKIKNIEADIFEETNCTFNINSPKQLGEILFEKLNIQQFLPDHKVKKSKIGYSTSFDVLKKYSAIPVVKNIIEYRTLVKLKNTYIDALPELIDKKTKRLHTRFHQAVTQTGRLSSSNPNLQNIPIKGEVGSMIRKAFIAPEGYLILCADYSQIELRILAHLSKDKNLIKAFEEGKDIHTQTASIIFHIKEEDVTAKERSQAKAVNFGIIYGMGARKLALDTGITFQQANSFINEYFEYYFGVRKFIDETIDKARKTEVVKTILGRCRHIPEINSGNAKIRSAAERIAVNTPIQGSAADIIKLAMIEIYKRIKKEKIDAKMLLQVHDELVFEVKIEHLNLLKFIVENEMTNAFKLIVPLVVNISSGKNWLEAH